MQRLPNTQEKHLCGWILIQGEAGLSPTHNQVRELAEKVAHLNGDTKPLGKNWLQGFLHRNPEVKTLRGKRLDIKRINGASTDAIKEFFRHVDLPALRNIPPRHRYNMDETGLAIGQRENGLVLGSSKKRMAIKKQSGLRYWSTIIECISATGRKLNPLVIFQGDTVQQQYFPDKLKPFAHWFFEATRKGWTNDDIAIHWLKTVFIPETKPQRPSRRLLVVDGHGSHCTTEFLWECYQNNIFILFLPAHSSHVLQPLDVAVFGPVKKYHTAHLGRHPTIADSSPLGKRIFLECYLEARELGITKANVIAGWRAAGLWPINIARPLLSPLLLPKAPQRPVTPKKPLTPLTSRYIDIVTPTNGRAVKRLFSSLERTQKTSPTYRLIKRKIQKGIDVQNSVKITSEIQIGHLQQQIDDFKPRRQKRVQQDPNKSFVTVIECNGLSPDEARSALSP